MDYDGYDGDHPALELINSERWYGRRPAGGEDVLVDPSWLEGYLARWSLAGVPVATAADRRKLSELRTLLRRTYAAVAETGQARPVDIRALDAVAARSPLRRRLVSDGGAVRVALEPVRRDWEWVAAEVAASLADLLALGDWQRVKLCENPECLCAFYDESKNRSRRWCYPQVCGNLDKVRRFRARRRGDLRP